MMLPLGGSSLVSMRMTINEMDVKWSALTSDRMQEGAQKAGGRGRKKYSRRRRIMCKYSLWTLKVGNVYLLSYWFTVY